MVGVQTGGQAGRYKLLETLRQYGQERLAENGEGDVRRLHAQYYAAMAQRASNPLAVVEDGYLMRLELEQDNLRTALAWALTNDREVALQIAAALSPPHWHLRGSLRERHQWLAEVTATSCAPSAALARALTSAGWVAFWEGDYEQSRALADQGLRIARDLGAASEVALAVNLRGVLFHVVDEDLEAARRWYAEAYEIRSELNDRRGMASTLSNLALLEYDAGALEVAESLAREAVAQLDEAAGRLTLGGLWDNLARIVLDRGRPAESRRHHRANLMLAQELDNKADIADALDGLARVAAAEGEPERALMIAGASYALHDRIGYEIHKPWRRRLKTSIDSARAAIRPEEADAAWERGARLSEREAVLVALGSPTEAAEDSADVAKVTAREREVAALIAAGLSNKEIGNRLTISERTVESHIEHIRSKLQVRSRAEIAVWATRIGLAPSAVVTAAR
jgi:non-specific serine/threonine protein kinase